MAWAARCFALAAGGVPGDGELAVPSEQLPTAGGSRLGRMSLRGAATAVQQQQQWYGAGVAVQALQVLQARAGAQPLQWRQGGAAALGAAPSVPAAREQPPPLLAQAAQQQQQEARTVVRWRADLEKTCIVGCFDRRGWDRCDEEGEEAHEWNVYWANVGSVKAMFSSESATRLRDDQVVNHFPNHYELTRKDLMIKNLKRFRREGGPEPTFLPASYILPVDYSLFLEEFRKQPEAVWIAKPSAKARGIGIFLVTRLAQVRRWSQRYGGGGGDTYVICRYIERPLLIGGKKFDLRMYVLVTSYRPLQAYFYGEGFARFCATRYDSAATGNLMVHLTNVSVQQHNEDYNNKHGGKWSIGNLKLYLAAMFGSEATRRLFEDIQACMLHSLRAVQSVMVNDKHCFEVYGYDMLIDEGLRPWLLEINASPALTATTKSDRQLKHSLLHNVFNIVLPSVDLPADVRERQRVMADIVRDSNFTVLADDEARAAPSQAPGAGSSSGPPLVARRSRLQRL